MPDTYGEFLAELVDDMARYDDRPDIFRRNDISRNHFYNVTNPNRESTSGKPYHCPTEWGVKLTGIQQKEIARAIGTSDRNVTAHLNDHRQNAITQKNIAKFYGIPTEELFENE